MEKILFHVVCAVHIVMKKKLIRVAYVGKIKESDLGHFCLNVAKT